MRTNYKEKLNREVVLMVLREYRGGFLTSLDVSELIPENYEWFDPMPVLKSLAEEGLVERIDKIAPAQFGKFYGWRLK